VVTTIGIPTITPKVFVKETVIVLVNGLFAVKVYLIITEPGLNTAPRISDTFESV